MEGMPRNPGRLMEISVTLRGRADEPVTFSFGTGPQLPPVVQAAIQQSLQASSERAQQAAVQRSAAEGQPEGDAFPVPRFEAFSSARAMPSTTTSTGPPREGPAPPPGPGEAALPQLRRLSGAIAGSIFQDLISGAVRMGDAGPPPASEQAIAKLVRNVQPSPGTQCPVCLMDFESSHANATRMPCGHCFHDECLLQWLRAHNTCPVCRFAVEPEPTPRMTPLVTMLQGLRESQAAGEAARASGSAGRSGTVPALGMELQGGQLRVFHAELRASTSAPAAAAHGPSNSAAAYSATTASTATGPYRQQPPAASMPGSSSSTSQSSASGETDAQLNRLSIAQLKERLTALGVDYSQVVEKRELIDLLRQHSAPAPDAAPTPRLHVQVHMDMLQLPPLDGPPPGLGDGPPAQLTSEQQQRAALAAAAIESVELALAGGAARAATSAVAASTAAALALASVSCCTTP